MSFCDRILENRCVMSDGSPNSRGVILNQTLEYYVRFVLALAVDLVLRPEYDGRFHTRQLKLQRRAWEIAVRYFIVLPDDNKRSQLERVCERYFAEAIDQGVFLSDGEKTEVRALVDAILTNARTHICFNAKRTMGAYLALAQALIDFNQSNLNATWKNLKTELDELQKLREAVKAVVDDRNNAVHEFFGALHRNDFDFGNNYFLRGAELVIIRNDVLVDKKYWPCLMLSDPKVALELQTQDLLRLPDYAEADKPYFRHAGMNGFALTPWRTVMLRVQHPGMLAPRYYLLSPLVACRKIGEEAEPTIFLSIPNKVLGEFRYLSLRGNTNAITWEETGTGDVNMVESMTTDTTCFPVVDWKVPWARLTDANCNEETTEIARPDGNGVYRINILADELGRTYPDFASCLRVGGAPEPFCIPVHDQLYLEKLRLMFYREGCDTPILHVTGKGGVGKTYTVLNTLRTEYVANEIREKAALLLPFDYVLFLTAKTIQYSVEGMKRIEPYPRSSFSNTRSAFHRLLCCLRGRTLEENPGESVDVMQYKIINEIAAKKVMLILDDLDSVEGVRNAEDEPQYLADQREQRQLVNSLEKIRTAVLRNGGELRVIITTRHSLDSYRDLALKPLSDPGAVNFAQAYYNKGRVPVETLPEDCRNYVKLYGEGTPGFIIRIVHMYRTNPAGDFWSDEENKQALRHEIAKFSLTTTRLRRAGQYIMQMLLDYQNLTLPTSLIDLVLFDSETLDNADGIQDLRDWNLIVDVPQANGSIALQGETLLLYNEIDNRGEAGLPIANKRVLDALLNEYRRIGRRYNAQDIAEILPRVCRMMLSDFKGKKRLDFAERLRWLINRIPLADQLTAEDRQELNRLADEVINNVPRVGAASSGVPVKADNKDSGGVGSGAAGDPRLVQLKQMIQKLSDVVLEDEWLWDASALMEMLECLYAMGPAADAGTCRSAIGTVKDHLERMSAQVLFEDYPSDQVRVIVQKMCDCCRAGRHENLRQLLRNYEDMQE